MKLTIEKILIRNFRSLGDHGDQEVIHEIDLLKRGAVLICGMNGAGKTSIIEAIVWCLFGKLSDNQNAGDNIINWEAGSNCKVSIVTADGYEIIRTRKYEGHSDLLITKDGNPIEDGDSTNANAQIALNNLFDLDFNSFIASLFFGQASGSFLTLSDSKKKLVIENLFGLSKLTCYAKIAKERINKCDELHTSIKEKISDIEASIKSTEKEIIRYRSLSEDFEGQRKDSVGEQQKEIKELTESRQEIVDVEAIKTSWDVINKGNDRIKQFKDKKDTLNNELKNVVDQIIEFGNEKVSIEADKKSTEKSIKQLQKRIDEWEAKKGTTCPTCEQTVTKTFVSKKIKSVKKENDEWIKQQEIEINNCDQRLMDVNAK